MRTPRFAILAFSLVEVVLAMGIVSFSVLVVIGLLSTASDTNRRAREEGFAAQITANEFERLRALDSSSPFWPTTGGLPTYATRFYDSNLADLGTSGPPPPDNAVYALSITLSAAPQGTADLLLDAEVRYPALAPAANQNLYRFTGLLYNPAATPTPTPPP